MNIILWLCTILLAVGFTYVLQFTESTRLLGKELSNTGSQTGLQDAITPPWQAKFAIFIYLSCVAMIITMWWFSGWIFALGCAGLIFLSPFILKPFLPNPRGSHFRNLIIKSMCNRYANFVKQGDKVRANSMKNLLLKVGIDPEKLSKTH